MGLTVKKSEDLSGWYQQVVLKSELADYSPVAGCMVFRPWSYSIWENLREAFDSKIKDLGHANAYFPLLIPESLLKREGEHFEGFIPEVAWVTKGGDTELDEKLAIRPTSETIMYYMYSKWIKSYRDLPLLINQWNNVVRWDTSSTRLFLRTREFLWQEGHTAHATEGECDVEVRTILDVYAWVARELLALPVIKGKKSEGEKFPGAVYTATIEAMMPDGKAVQAGTSHNLGQNFSKVFDISFLDKDQTKKYAWQTSWGISTRLIGALVMIHGDDRGLIIPPRVAPVQVVIVPIYYKESDRAAVTAEADRVSAEMKKTGLRVKLDDRDDRTPGWKFNEWELKGVPLRVELGPRDLARKQAVLVRRDTGEKLPTPIIGLAQSAESLLEAIHGNLLARAENTLRGLTTEVASYDEFKSVLDSKGGFVVSNWCTHLECERSVKQETGATVRVIPFDSRAEDGSRCFKCGAKATVKAYFARSY
ncbi:MAG: proline--tRNA ligase [Candidatus Marsarchaeota archaeon]|nr:proline--tRNA ligase [Candidatus Marsarchaeota archaeon]